MLAENISLRTLCHMVKLLEVTVEVHLLIPQGQHIDRKNSYAHCQSSGGVE